ADKEKAAASVESDWDVYSEYVVKHIHRIPREGVEALAEILLIDKNVVEACAGKAPLVQICYPKRSLTRFLLTQTHLLGVIQQTKQPLWLLNSQPNAP
nr:hypothetical protein CTI12_AA046580 [Tanacetum cinerariifolium]